MIKYGERKNTLYGFGQLAEVVILLNFDFFEWLLKPKTKKDISKLTSYTFIAYQCEIVIGFLLFIICRNLLKSAEPFSLYQVWIAIKSINIESLCYFCIFSFLFLSWNFYLCRQSFPYWVDDDKAEEIEEPSKSSFQQNTEDLDAVVKPAVDKEIANIQQDQAADEMAQQSSRNTGGKNTEITVNVVNGLDLNNKTIILPQKPKQSNQDNKQ